MRKYIYIIIFVFTCTVATFALSNEKLSPALKFLLATRQSESAIFSSFNLNMCQLDLMVRFDHPLTNSEIAQLEASGIEFKRVGGKIYGEACCYGLKAPYDEVSSLSDRADVIQLTSVWKPKIVPCLDVSNPEVQANQAWGLENPAGLPITGEGVLIADFDTGIDVFHPAFFRTSTDTLDWIDTDGNNAFTPGIDAVDLNHNQQADPGELLNFIEGQIRDDAGTFGGSGGISNNDQIYQPEWDWLYNDVNASGVREYGFWNGFSETDPTYGELLLISLDQNQNSQLDPGEKLLPLAQSKIYATYNGGDTVRIRGEDLIFSQPDNGGHGTAVSGILAGGTPGVQKFTGIAPGADLLMGYFFYGVSFNAYLPWVREQGCKILLYEFGSWVFNPLDGSSVEELLIDFEALMGVQQVIPSGNLNRGFKHCQTISTAIDTIQIDFIVAEYQGAAPSAVWLTVLWREPNNNINFGLIEPSGSSLMLNGNGTYQTLGDYEIYSYRSTSYRGTAEYDIFIFAEDDVLGNWTLIADNNSLLNSEINGYISDDVSAWAGGAEFTEFHSNMKTVTWPATADSAFVLGSYSTRGYEQYIGVGNGTVQIGQLSVFSGRGPRIDGLNVLSVISPGNYDVYSSRYSGDYPYTYAGWRQFSGTSAAGPHVAGSCALIRQMLPQASQYEIGRFLELSAFKDGFTGPTYNDSCGYGKIRVFDALLYADVTAAEISNLPVQFQLKCFPNPFNQDINIKFHLSEDGITKVEMYNIIGQKVAVIMADYLSSGDYELNYDCQDLASGIYFLSVKTMENIGLEKLVLLK